MTELLTVEQVASAFNVSKAFVYERAAELGGYRLNDAPNAPLRFDPETVKSWLSERKLTPAG